MKVKDILQSSEFHLISNESGLNKEVNGIFSSDLLSHVMGFAGENNILITVLNNINVLGVASLLDFSCVIFPHNVKVNESIINKANELEIPLIGTSLSTSKSVLSLYKLGVED
ncbi:MAG: serine kinase [Bacilli bacterium]|nr:serine kinase [Bacilli bacterium]